MSQCFGGSVCRSFFVVAFVACVWVVRFGEEGSDRDSCVGGGTMSEML